MFPERKPYRLTFLLMFCVVAGFGQMNSKENISIGGIRQYIEIKGVSAKNPVLLFLHGGPGNSVIRYADKFTGELQKHFLVVQWDQRESGKTAGLNPSDKPLTVGLMESDAVEIITYLQNRFSQNKIYLMGHSWGGFLALVVAAHHPELLHACFAVSPMINQIESERQSLEWMNELSKKEEHPEAIRELQLVKVPFENAEQLYYHRKHLARFSGQNPPSKSFVMSWAKKWFAMYMEASLINLFESAPELRCPVYFFAGSRDRQTYFKITEEYYKAVKAEKKELFWFPNSGHNLNLTEPKKMQDDVISVLKPKI